MFSISNKHQISTTEQAEWFVDKTQHILFNEAYAKKEYFTLVKAYFNPKVECCIIRLTIDERFTLSIEGQFLYIMLDYKAKEKINFGRNLESVISDKETYISWIHGNEVLTFYPDQHIVRLLAKKL